MNIPRRCPSLLLIILAGLVVSCRDGRLSTPRTVVDEPRVPAPQTSPEPGVALDAANDAVEAARILAIGVPSLHGKAIRGFALPMYTELPDLTYRDMLRRVRDAGATHVSIVSSWDQQTIHHNRLRPSPSSSPTAEELGAIIDEARSLGLKTLMFPIIHVERRNEGEWRGKLAPTDPQRWQQSYRRFIAFHVDVAQAHRVDMLSVGSELSSLEDEDEFWRSLIAETRGRFDGELLYSANWDHFEHPTFWDALDYVGVSSYFEVARHQAEPIFAVTDRWLKHRDDLVAFARDEGKPLILTEVGYPAIDSAAVKPWDYTARTPPNANAQLAAFQSLATAWTLEPDDRPHFAGLFIWHAWGHGGDADTSYPVWGKSTEHLVRRWYGAVPQP